MLALADKNWTLKTFEQLILTRKHICNVRSNTITSLKIRVEKAAVLKKRRCHLALRCPGEKAGSIWKSIQWRAHRPSELKLWRLQSQSNTSKGREWREGKRILEEGRRTTFREFRLTLLIRVVPQAWGKERRSCIPYTHIPLFSAIWHKRLFNILQFASLADCCPESQDNNRNLVAGVQRI